jgi:hypothetical protein
VLSAAGDTPRGAAHIVRVVKVLCDVCGQQIPIPAKAIPKIVMTGGTKTPGARVIRVGINNVHRCEINRAEARPRISTTSTDP